MLTTVQGLYFLLIKCYYTFDSPYFLSYLGTAVMKVIKDWIPNVFL